MARRESEMSTYEVWRQRYSGEGFDRAQALAAALTDSDRASGRQAPAFGYSRERFAEAQTVVRDSQR